MKKVLSLALMVAIVLSLVSFASAEPEYSVTLRIEVYDRGNMPAEYGTPDNNRWTQWIQENFGDPNGIKLEYVPIPRGESDVVLNTMMAGGNAPDIVFSYSETLYYDYALKGGLYDITDLVDEYGDNLKANVSMDYGVYQGHRYAIFARRLEQTITCHFIRKDWLDRIGYELKVNEDGFYHMSVDDLTECLAKFKELDLDGTGQEVFPIGANGSGNVSRSTRGIFESFYNRAEIDEKMRVTTPNITWPGFYEGLEWLNMAYNNRWIDPDFVADTDNSQKLLDYNIVTGRCGYWTHDAWHGVQKGEALEQLYLANPEAEVVAFQLDNVYGEQMVELYAPTGMVIMVPATAKDEVAEAAVKYLNWLADPKVHLVLYYGIEGEHWEMVDGVPRNIDEQYVAETKISTSDLAIIYNGDPNYGAKMIVLACPEVIQPIRATTIELGMVGGFERYSFGQPIVAETEYGTTLDSKRGELLATCIMCAPEELKANYDQKVAEYMNIGGQAVIDEKTQVYEELNN
ncbi:MAG: extracellular solute-binding protein [Clostridia bacterium]|nr:extracellular solute-binding protein [Clostridia bacterium]